MKRLLLLILLVSSVLAASAQDVSIKTLLPEMTDLARLAKRPNPPYTNAQASSYDRASKDPKTEWFANADAGKFLRVETKADRREYVMADIQGPGTVMRVWSANPSGIIRFYFDGEERPRLQANMADLLRGKVAPFKDPFAYEAAKGTNLYFPIPYAKGLKVTVDDSLGNDPKNLYYQVNYRTYSTRVMVDTYSQKQLDEQKALIERTAATLIDPSKRPMPAKVETIKQTATLAPQNAHVVDLPEGANAIYQIKVKANVKPGPAGEGQAVWNNPAQPHNILRSVILSGQFDDDLGISAPLGDFFGSAPGINPYKSFPMEVQKDGTMICRFVMPYKESGAIILTNEGQAPVSFDIELQLAPFVFDEATYYFKAQWTAETGMTHPHHDMTLLNVKGEGVWIGSNLHVTNPRPDWWGEGDEKVYVDNEAFPSTFGTGTEDYYGYAWCSPLLFERPYHAQPRVDGPGNMGQSSVNRWHIFDPIPFKSALKFDLEMWHWANVYATYARTAYWYAKPGGDSPVPINRTLLQPRFVEKPQPVKGAIEGEKLKATASGGVVEAQGGFWDLSAGEQLWWKNMASGDKLVIKVPVKEAGTYELVGNFCHNRDYGIHLITVNGTALEPIDFFATAIKWQKVALGTHRLPAGEITIVVESKGRREEALEGNMFGLDYLLLQKK